MLKLTGTIGKLNTVKILVAGDLMLDVYTQGKAKRISPEAPVPVVQVVKQTQLPGGAGNVVLNLRSLGAQVAVLGRIGADASGDAIASALRSEYVETRGLVVEKGYSTPVKNRIIANQQQMIRIDHETISDLPQDLEEVIVKDFPNLFQDVKILAISDYGKGFFTDSLLKKLIAYARECGVQVLADPKGSDFSRYRGVDLIKPNLSEAYAAAGMDDKVPLATVAKRVLEQTEAQVLMVTRSEEGISLFYNQGQEQHFPVHAKEVKDVTGAGDTVLAMLAMSLANELDLSEAVQLSNVAASLAIEKLGCVRVSLSQLARRLLALDISNKVFDEEHLFALQAALNDRKLIIVGISSQEGLTNEIYRTLMHFSDKQSHDLLVYIRDDEPCNEFVNILASLREVDYIVLKKESLEHLCQVVDPVKCYILDDKELIEVSHVDVLAHR
jgi:D-beta-D-heptose 7-phosphate kinase/D-beta-D-heptose 1-phosphate adenosyltransferase